MIELINVSKIIRSGFQEKEIIKNISLTIQEGEFVAISGENGAGKTTLLNIILGLLKTSKGEVKLFEKSPQDPRSKDRVGVVLQKVTVPKNIKVKELVNLLRSYYPTNITTEEILRRVDLEQQQDNFASKLSGGQEQRLYFALALAGNPKLLILDEPTKNLDIHKCEEFWNQIKACREKGITILMVTHSKSDWEQLEQLATRKIVLESGQVTEDIKIREFEFNSELLDNEKLQDISSNLKPSCWKLILKNQLGFELLQVLRTPLNLFLIFMFPVMTAFFSSSSASSQSSSLLMLICLNALIAVVYALDKLGITVAQERIEGWLKLLKVTPLDPKIYLSAKVIVHSLILSLLLLFSLGLGELKSGIEIDLMNNLIIVFILIVGTIPFGFLSLALGYMLEPKSFNIMTIMLLSIFLFSCGLDVPGTSKLIQDLISLSPSYHYGQLTLASLRNLEEVQQFFDNHIFLNTMWLLWYGIVFGYLAIWSYQREKVVQ